MMFPLAFNAFAHIIVEAFERAFEMRGTTFERPSMSGPAISSRLIRTYLLCSPFFKAPYTA